MSPPAAPCGVMHGIGAYWTQFARYGDPNNASATLPHWPVYDTIDDTTVLLDSQFGTESKYRADADAFWRSALVRARDGADANAKANATVRWSWTPSIASLHGTVSLAPGGGGSDPSGEHVGVQVDEVETQWGSDAKLYCELAAGGSLAAHYRDDEYGGDGQPVTSGCSVVPAQGGKPCPKCGQCCFMSGSSREATA